MSPATVPCDGPETTVYVSASPSGSDPLRLSAEVRSSTASAEPGSAIGGWLVGGATVTVTVPVAHSGAGYPAVVPSSQTVYVNVAVPE